MRGSTAGLADGIISPSHTAHGILLELLDTIISSFVIAPTIVGYWRGTWNLMNHYLYPNDLLSSSISSLIIGIFGHLIFNIFQDTFKNTFNRDKHRLIYYIASRVYTALFGIVCVNGWRGGWQLIDRYTTTSNVSIVLLITVTCVIILLLLKASRNISASPFFLATDDAGEYFDIPTMFKTSVRETTSKSSSSVVITCY